MYPKETALMTSLLFGAARAQEDTGAWTNVNFIKLLSLPKTPLGFGYEHEATPDHESFIFKSTGTDY